MESMRVAAPLFRLGELDLDQEQLARVDGAHDEVVVAVLAVVEVEAPEAALVPQEGHDVLDVDLLGVVAEVHEHLGPLARGAGKERAAPQSWRSVW